MEDPLLSQSWMDLDRQDSPRSFQHTDDSKSNLPVWRRFVWEDLLSPLLGTTVLLPFAVAFTGVIVSALPELAPHTPTLLSTVLLSQGLGTLLFSRYSQYTTCVNIDLLSAAFFAQFGAVLKQQVRYEQNMELKGDELLVAMLLTQGFFTFLVGACLCVVAAMDGMWYLRFLPYPVACGFVSGIGLIVVDGGFELGVGMGMKDLAFNWNTLPAEKFMRAGYVVLVGVFFLQLKKFVRNAMRLPTGLIVVTLVVHGGAYLCGVSEETLVENGVFLRGLQAEPWTASWEALGRGLHSVEFSTYFSEPCLSILISYALLHILVYPFYATGMQDVDSPYGGRLDLKSEINMLGVTNLAVGAVAGVPSCHSYKVAIVMKQSGGQTRVWVVLLGFTFLFLYFDTSIRPLLGVIPKYAFGGLVFSLGWDFLAGSLLESRARVQAVEWRAVIITAMVIYFNVLVGLTFGCMVTMGLFVIEYAGITGITSTATLADIRSLWKRPQREAELLDKYGSDVAVFWCSGYIFFGTATNIVEEVETHLDENPATMAVVMDFESVPAVDASGVHALTEFSHRCSTRSPPVEICFCGLVRRLHLALKNVVTAKSLAKGPKLLSSRLEGALEWAEELILSCPQYRNDVSLRSPVAISRTCNTSGNSNSMGISMDDLRIPLLVEMLFEIAPTAPEDAVREVAKAVVDKTNMRLFDSKARAGLAAKKGVIHLEGDPAVDLAFVTKGRAELRRTLDVESSYKLPRHHLNSEKGDLFRFEESTEVRVEQAERGALLGTIEFGASLLPTNCMQPPRHLTSAVAAPQCEVLLVPFAALHEALMGQPSVGYLAMTWLSARASTQVLELAKSANMRPWRKAATDEPVFSQAIQGDEEAISCTSFTG
mmetsp:Transcript_206/g.464  ORF Transcript_206/g.464 Transcript_206/m.464 type:complete len:881 (+) Transcript_206:53-2695(+)